VALILRKVTRVKWLPGAGEGTRSDDEVAAEDFQDLDNEISVWEIDDERSNLLRIIAAIAATRDFLANIDYVLFNSALASNLQIDIQKQNGDTPDHVANLTWHRDLMTPTRDQIWALVAAIRSLNPQDPAIRIKDRDVLQHLKRAVDSAWIDRDALKPQLSRKVIG
jgi:hypothetical protein